MRQNLGVHLTWSTKSGKSPILRIFLSNRELTKYIIWMFSQGKCRWKTFYLGKRSHLLYWESFYQTRKVHIIYSKSLSLELQTYLIWYTIIVSYLMFSGKNKGFVLPMYVPSQILFQSIKCTVVLFYPTRAWFLMRSPIFLNILLLEVGYGSWMLDLH